MDALQIALLLTGIATIVGVYLFGFRQSVRKRSGKRSVRAGNDRPAAAGDELIAVPAHTAPVPTEDLAAMGQMIAGDIREHPERHPVSGVPAPDLSMTDRPAGRPARQNPQAAPEFILQLLVVSRDSRRFRGPDLVNAMTRSGLVLGDRDIFHCRIPGDGDQPVFSVANLLEPGSFNMNFIDHFETPGLLLFMTLPGPADGKSAFNRMLTTARQLASALHGDVRDETRSVLTPQGIEHLQQLITEFQRKRQVESRRAAHA
ncbi:MAG: cell division protein ZipA [Gammaproteobacteria bacterium]|nr:MAG: cell division protein ZipA [Gammaproteobacteria bacterium]TND06896.1 MAG: cell division protein ZipA [Gammaproteobacteria bacterium]